MEKEASHDGSNLIIKTIVLDDHVRRREKQQMAHQTIRELTVASPLPALDTNLGREHRSAQSHADSSALSSNVPADPRSSTSSTPAEAANTTHSTADKESTSKDLAAPLITVLDLLTDSAAPSALPQTLGFQMSRKGRQIGVYNATHIHLIDTEALPRAFVRSLEIKRRPVALDMLDDGSLLLLLDTSTTLNVYSMNGGDGESVERKCSFDLQHESKTIAISPDGLVVAAGHRFGIELIALETNAKRLVSVDRMDYLSFSDDSRTLLATTKANKSGSSTTISVADPFDGPISLDGIPAPVEVDRAWTTQILFPEKAKTCRHAVILPEEPCGPASALFAFNTVDATWGIYNIDACAFVYAKEFLPSMPSWTKTELIESAIPAVSPLANYVAVAVKQHGHPEIWVYRLPRDYEEELLHSQSDSDNPEDKNALLRPCLQLPLPRDESLISQEVAALRWLKLPQDESVERLVAVGSTVRATEDSASGIPQLPQSSTSTGVIVVMDFDQRGQAIQGAHPHKIVFDLDTLLPGEKLPEDEFTFEREVELMRRRTVAQRQAADRAATRRSVSRNPPVIRAATTRPRPSGPHSPHSPMDIPPVPPVPGAAAHGEDELNPDEAAAAFEEPYTHAQPRSQASLQRAATVAASSSAARRHLRALPDQPLEYRRADGLREIPHESDADNWVPPPPPYTPNPGPSDARVVASTPVMVPPVPRIPPAGSLSTSPPSSRINSRRVSQILSGQIPSPTPGAGLPPTPASVRVPALPSVLSRNAGPAQTLSSSPLPPPSSVRRTAGIAPLSSVVPPRRPVRSPPRNANRNLQSPAALQPSATFPRVSPPEPHPAAHMVPDASGTGLRRSSSTFPQPADSRPGRTRGAGSRSQGSRPSLHLQTNMAGPPGQVPLSRRLSQTSHTVGTRSASAMDNSNSNHRNRDMSAYYASRAASAVDLRLQRPAKQKQEKKGMKCVIM